MQCEWFCNTAIAQESKIYFQEVAFQKTVTLQIIIRCFQLSQHDMMDDEKNKLNILSLSWFTA